VPAAQIEVGIVALADVLRRAEAPA